MEHHVFKPACRTQKYLLVGRLRLAPGESPLYLKSVIYEHVTNGSFVPRLCKNVQIWYGFLAFREALDAIADKGYFKSEDIRTCEDMSVTAFVPRPLTLGAKAQGRFGQPDFVYLEQENVYRCPAGEDLIYRGRGRPDDAQLLELELPDMHAS